MKDVYEEIENDDTVWDRFVESWIGQNPDRVKEIVNGKLTEEVNEPGSVLGSIWSMFISLEIENRTSEEEDRRYQEMKEEAVIAEIEKEGK